MKIGSQNARLHMAKWWRDLTREAQEQYGALVHPQKGECVRMYTVFLKSALAKLASCFTFLLANIL
jgi:hypothetical protein